jgi:hypothetical protein
MIEDYDVFERHFIENIFRNPYEDRYFIECINIAMINYGMDKIHIGDLIGITPKSIECWTNGKSLPDFDSRRIILNKLAILVDE